MKLTALILLAVPAFCQPISVGIKVGAPLDRAGSQGVLGITVDKPRWTIGPTVEARIHGNFFVGADALFRRMSHNAEWNTGSGVFFENSKTSRWEVPVFVKYRLGERRFRPFILGGGAYERAHITGSAGCRGGALSCGDLGPGTFPIDTSDWGAGWLVGGGVEFGLGPVKVAPEFRYTRWLRGYSAGAGTNQPAVLLGIRF